MSKSEVRRWFAIAFPILEAELSLGENNTDFRGLKDLNARHAFAKFSAGYDAALASLSKPEAPKATPQWRRFEGDGWVYYETHCHEDSEPLGIFVNGEWRPVKDRTTALAIPEATTHPAETQICLRRNDGACQSAVDNGDQGCMSAVCEMGPRLASLPEATAQAEPLQGLSAYLRAQAGTVHSSNALTLRNWALAVDAIDAAIGGDSKP
jgi:hypothetical protein